MRRVLVRKAWTRCTVHAPLFPAAGKATVQRNAEPDIGLQAPAQTIVEAIPRQSPLPLPNETITTGRDMHEGKKHDCTLQFKTAGRKTRSDITCGRAQSGNGPCGSRQQKFKSEEKNLAGGQKKQGENPAQIPSRLTNSCGMNHKNVKRVENLRNGEFKQEPVPNPD